MGHLSRKRLEVVRPGLAVLKAHHKARTRAPKTKQVREQMCGLLFSAQGAPAAPIAANKPDVRSRTCWR